MVKIDVLIDLNDNISIDIDDKNYTLDEILKIKEVIENGQIHNISEWFTRNRKN